MTTYRKLPVTIEAVQTRDVLHDAQHDWYALPQWIVDAYEGRNQSCKTLVFTNEGVHISTLEGVMLAEPDDWIIRGVQGELYPCKPDIFAATYEQVEDHRS